jgi:hypothetical protein
METVADKTAQYRVAVKEILAEFASVPYAVGELRDRTLFDDANNRYVVISDGWVRRKRYHGIIIDLEIVNGKVWIHADNTDIVIAEKLQEHGIPKSDIVLGFRAPDVRTALGYAAA